MNKRNSTKRYLGPVATRYATEPTGSWRMQRPVVDHDSCVRCGICTEYCPTGVLHLSKGENRRLEINWFNCKGCGICATLCPQNCIQMLPEEDTHD
jgi:2-oxoacid:acceptor oxidoreductase delta subunit (pyruvate/2-ketoisovalerate family)